MKNSILFITKSMSIGGVEKSLLSLLGTISPDDYEVDLLLLEDGGGFREYIPSWVNVTIADWYSGIRDEVNKPPLDVIKSCFGNKRIGRGLSLGIGYALYKLTGNNYHYFRRVFAGIPHLHKNYDVAVAFSSIVNYITWYTVYHVNAGRKVGWIHFDVSKSGCDRKITGLLHAQLNKIYVVSKQALDAFVAMFPELESKSEVRYNVVDKDIIRAMAEEPAEVLRTDGKAVIVTLGRLSAEKGQDIVPDIAKKLKDAGTSFRWYLIGDGKLRSTIEEKISRYGLENEVILLGTKPNPYPYLKQADVYVQTSLFEGFCITLAEAKVFGMPIISTEFAGAHEQLDSLPDCAVVEREPDSMANIIIEKINQRIS